MNEFPCDRCLHAGQCQVGACGVITCVHLNGENAACVRRLAELGIRRGAKITLGQRTPGGGRIVAVAGSNLALDAKTLELLHLAAA